MNIRPFIASIVILAICIGSSSSVALWPKPQFQTDLGQNLTLSSFVFRFQVVGIQSDILERAMERYTKLIFLNPYSQQQGRSSNIRVNSKAKKADNSEVLALRINVLSEDVTLGQDTDESYNLTVTPPYSTLSANTVYGAIRGLETFSQLVEYQLETNSFVAPATSIRDFPRFQFRGLLVDTARHWLPVKMILANLDAMSYNKMNVMHWHIVDSQSFPYVSDVYPLLSQKGAWTPTHIYTAEDIRTIIDYARDRGIRVIPEFDTPGHSTCWGYGYPDLMTECDPIHTPALNPISNYTYDFLTNLFTEVGKRFDDDYLHLGGDEVSFFCWMNNSDIQTFMAEKNWTDYTLLEEYYERKVLDIVGGLGKQYIVWQEIFNNGIKVLPNTVIEVWKGFDTTTLAEVVNAGLHVILSGGWYLDHLNTTPGTDDWIVFYLQEPTAFNASEALKEELMLGGEACMWGEHVDDTNFMSRVWPRASAVAERLWSSQDTRDIPDATERLHGHRCRLNWRGIEAESIGPGFCEVEFEFTYNAPF